ncbi:MAG: hypothetical protein IJS08_15720, partial [Victivallales bacterium]|nr:hypothetical protein [Victivallales bacterium]
MIEQRLILQNVIFRVPIECGVLEPYKCRCNDGRYYYVKGQYAGAQECIRELVCAEIGHRFGLPVPEFGIVDTKDISNSNPEIGKSLQGMPAFGSLEVKGCTEYLCKENTSKTSKEIYSKILFFDWWVQNPDRTKGHTNLLKTPDGRIWVIDHNMALCNGIGENIEAFKNEHALGDFGELFTFQPETYIH